MYKITTRRGHGNQMLIQNTNYLISLTNIIIFHNTSLKGSSGHLIILSHVILDHIRGRNTMKYAPLTQNTFFGYMLDFIILDQTTPLEASPNHFYYNLPL